MSADLFENSVIQRKYPETFPQIWKDTTHSSLHELGKIFRPEAKFHGLADLSIEDILNQNLFF